MSIKIVLPLTHLTESGRGRDPVLKKGPLAQWVRQQLSPWVIGLSLIGSMPRRRGRAIKNIGALGRKRVDETPGQSCGRVRRHVGLSLL